MKTRPRRKVNKPESVPKLVLEEVIGLTARNRNGLASNFGTARCVYTAGCVAVVYNVELWTQSHLMVTHRAPKPLSCVAISKDGRFVAAGEFGKQAAVVVWDCEALSIVSELRSHRHGVVSIAFSPDGKHLVSAGSTTDGYIYLWHCQSGMLVTKQRENPSSSPISSISFSSDGKVIVVAGKDYLKLSSIRPSSRGHLKTGAGSLLFGKPINVTHHKGSSFVSVACSLWTANDPDKMGDGYSPIFALTEKGVLCQLSHGFIIQKSVKVKVEKSFALSASNDMVACACNHGIVQIFTVETLAYLGELLYIPAKNREEGIDTLSHDIMPQTNSHCGSTLPNAIGCQFSTSEKLVVVYEDHSLYVWDVHDVCKPTRCCVLVSHSACVWDIKSLPCEYNHNPSLACAARGCSGGISFATCSGDGTIRLWDFTFQSILSDQSRAEPHSPICDTINTTLLESSGIFECESLEKDVNKKQFRSMAISVDGKYLAAGDLHGNLLIYKLHASTCVYIQDAHAAEILCLSFSSFPAEIYESKEVCEGYNLLASGGRDGIIHIYDVERDFVIIGTIDDHSSAVTSVQLVCNGSKIISGGANGSLISHDIDLTSNGCTFECCHHQKTCLGTFYDMFVDPLMEFAVTIGQDTNISTVNVASGEVLHSFKRNKDFGEPVKVTMDPSCSYLLCSYSNKTICLYDFVSGELVAEAMGHAEVATGVIFLPDCKHIVSVGGDGCIFVWKVPAPLSAMMIQRMTEKTGPLSPLHIAQPLTVGAFLVHEDDYENKIIHENLLPQEDMKTESRDISIRYFREASAFRFSISRLPKWAQKEVVTSGTPPSVTETVSSQLKDGYSTPLQGRSQGNALLHNGVDASLNIAVGDQQRILSSATSTATCNSEVSIWTGKNLSFSKKRWHTIHTVCLDLLSPDVSNSKSSNMPLSSVILLQSRKGPCNNNDKLVSSKGCYDCQHLSVASPNGNAHHFHDVNDLSKTLHQDQILSSLHLESKPDSLFTQHFGNLSAIKKVERTSCASRSYTSRFTVRRDHVRGSKTRLNMTSGTSSNSPISQLDLLEQGHDSESTKDMQKSDHLSPPESIITSIQETSMPSHLDQPATKERVPYTFEEQRSAQCMEALYGLNAAAEKVHKLFSNLGPLVLGETSSTSSEAHIYREAAKLLPSIAETIHAVSNLVHLEIDHSCQ